MARPFRLGTEDITFVLIGAPGSGKSSTGNSILGERRFKISPGAKMITTQCEISFVERFGKNISVIDTPGLETVASFSEIEDELRQIQVRSHPNNVVYALTIKIGRYTAQERDIVEGLFRQNKLTSKNCIIIFTNRNELNDEDSPADRTVYSWIKKHPSLKKLIHGNKLDYLEFENKRCLAVENDNQVMNLLSKSGVSSLDEDDEFQCPVSEKVEKKMRIIVDKKILRKCLVFTGEKSMMNKQPYRGFNVSKRNNYCKITKKRKKVLCFSKRAPYEITCLL